ASAKFLTGADGGARDQVDIPHPRAGFYGVLDERLDVELLREVACILPHVHFILLGPVVKIDPATLPSAPNLHYLGPKQYQDLPSYLAGWDVALLPFSRNEATRFISPTKTPEYLAAGKPVVSTPIRDVVREYGESGLVTIADGPEQTARAIEAALQPPLEAWREAVRRKLARTSWDRTWRNMECELAGALAKKISARSTLTHRTSTATLESLVAGAKSVSGVLSEHALE
ncbi:MAG: glycosyltransferase, partial [Terriglobus roseus]|nr:glycosyltransferase [Terriglobus roseus]